MKRARYPLESKLLDTYVNRASKSEGYRMSIRSYIEYFFHVINVKNVEKYIKSKRNFEEDIWKFAEIIKDNASGSQSVQISIIKRFFVKNKIDHDHEIWNDVKDRNQIRGKRRTVEKAYPDNNDVKIIIHHATNIKSKAFFMFLAKTGLRINEGTKITFQDINKEKRKVRVREDIAKKGYPRITFYDKECEEILNEWLKERSKYYLDAFKKSIYTRKIVENNKITWKTERIRKNSKDYKEFKFYKDGKEISMDNMAEMDNRVFPYSDDNFRKIWASMLERSGAPYNEKDMNPKLKRPMYKHNVHCLRRFWKSALGHTNINRNHMDYMFGNHSLLTESYMEFEGRCDELQKSYEEHSSKLAIFTELDQLDNIMMPRLKDQESISGELLRKQKGLERKVEVMKEIIMNIATKRNLAIVPLEKGGDIEHYVASYNVSKEALNKVLDEFSKDEEKWEKWLKSGEENKK